MKVEGRQRERRFPRDTPLKTIRRWQDERGLHCASYRGAPSTRWQTDAERYLKQIEGQVIGIATRRQEIET